MLYISTTFLKNVLFRLDLFLSSVPPDRKVVLISGKFTERFLIFVLLACIYPVSHLAYLRVVSLRGYCRSYVFVDTLVMFAYLRRVRRGVRCNLFVYVLFVIHPRSKVYRLHYLHVSVGFDMICVTFTHIRRVRRDACHSLNL